ncbi:zinc finger, CCHC-type containing protein [Tanacetum coccineum]
MDAVAMKHMASNFAKLDKFEGVDFRRWQKKMHFLLSSMSVVYVLITLIPEDGGDDETVEQIRKRAKWDNDDYVCRDSLEAKYMAEDASSKKFLVSNFTNYKMTYSRPVMEQYNELLGIVGRFIQHKINMDEAIQVSCIIDKLPHSWKDFKHTLKLLKEELTLVELGSHLRIKKSLRMQDSDKPKGNNVAGPYNQMFRINIVNDNIASAFMSTSKLNDSILWHARLGHVHFKRMQDMSKDGLILAFNMDTKKCNTCMLTKITKKPFQNVKRETGVLELIYSDLCDMHATPSLGNKKYFVTFIDDASREVVRIPDPKLKSLGERGIECIFVGYAKHSKAFRFFVIEPNESISINSIIESRDAIFDENRFSLIPRPSLSIPKGTKDISGPVVPEEVIKEDDPKTFDEAIKSQDVAFWKEAINDEMDSIMGNNTWVLADLPPGCKPLGCKWIFKRKLKYHKTADCYGINSQSNYSSDGCEDTHAFLTSQYTWHQRLGHPGSEVLRHLVSSDSISCNKEKLPVLCHVCQLGKHVKLPFVSSSSSVTSCFDIVHSDLWTYPIPTPVHTPLVDVPTPPTPPTSLTPPPPPTPHSVPQIILEHVPAPTNDPPTVSIHPMVTRSRVETTRPNPRYAWSCCSTYISTLPRGILLDSQSKLGDGDSILVLLYEAVCLYMHDPREPHFSVLKRILRYVHGTLDYGLQLFSSTTDSLIASSDADWAGCPTTRRSTSRYYYRVLANAVAETCWIRNLLCELHTPLSSATIVYCDNVSVVYLSSNAVQHQRTKHIEIDIHFVWDLVATGQVRVLHVPSRFQYADIFTKGLPSALFEEFRTNLSVWCPPAPTAGEYTNYISKPFPTLTTPIPKDGGDDLTVEQVWYRNKKELWDSFEAKYMSEDASSKKSLVSNFTNYKITNSRPVMKQHNELLGTRGRFIQHKMNIDKAIQVSCIIDKLPPSCKDFKHTLKHKKEELTLVELDSHLCIKESLRAQDRNKKYFVTFIDDASRAVVRLPDPKLKTLDERGIKCIFVGYAEHSKAFRPSLRIPNGNEDVGGSVVPEKVTKEDDPKTFDEAMKSQDVAFWKKAINDEMDSIMGNNTWVLADLPPCCKPLSCKWILKRKMKVDGMIEKFKARLVIQGFKQKSGIDYFDTYAPDIGEADVIFVSTPMDTSEKLMPNNGQAVSQLEYSRVIGCLMYAMTCTSPDIAFAVGKLSRHTSNPGTQHWQAIQRVLKYLKKTMDYRLTYTSYPLVLEGYTDASWINNTEDNSSTSGWVFMLSGGVISWASKKQTCITGSTIEFEFVALAAAGKEAE